MSRPDVVERQATASATFVSSLSLNHTGGELGEREFIVRIARGDHWALPGIVLCQSGVDDVFPPGQVYKPAGQLVH